MLLQKRNVSADPAGGQPATAARLFEAALSGGWQAAGQKLWGLTSGARADMLVLNPQASGLLGIPADYSLDALVFACDTPALRDVFVAGRQRIFEGRHLAQESISAKYVQTMAELRRN
jgi:formimidoylglutamate deiminase